MNPVEPPDPPGPGLSPRRREILHAIGDSTERRGYSPTLREIAHVVGLASTSTVSYHLSILEDQGYVSRRGNRARTAVVHRPARPGVHETGEGGTAPGAFRLQEVARVPLTDGRIAAGGPILAEGSVEDVFFLPKQLVGDGELFILKVVGDSMIGAAIADGDWVVVRRRTDAENGDIVAAVIGESEHEATIKTFKRSDGHVWLIPQNPAYEPINGDKAEILGRVVAVLRRL